MNDSAHDQSNDETAASVFVRVDTRSAQCLVTFFRSPMVVTQKFLSTHGPTPPFEPAYIAAGLRRGNDIAVIDAQGETVARNTAFDSPIGPAIRIGLTTDEIVERLPLEAKIIGISLMFFREWPVTNEDVHVLQRLFDTGGRNIVYAPESGGERMVTKFAKKVDLDHVLKSVATVHQIGLKTHVSIIIGHPDERPADLWKSTTFMLQAALISCDDAAAIKFCPYPGSADFERLVESGRPVIENARYYAGLGRSSATAAGFNDRIPSRALYVAQLAMMAAFYGTAMLRRSARAFDLIKARTTGNDTTYLDQMVRSRRQVVRSQGPV